MNHKELYIELTKLSEIFRANLKSSYSINTLVQLTDHSIEESPPSIDECLKICPVGYQFQVKDQRGFVLFPDTFGHWLISELLGDVAPDQSSMLENFSYQLVIDDVFKKSPLFENFQRVDVNGIWVHPIFDQFYPMSFTILKTRTESIQSWCFIPKEIHV